MRKIVNATYLTLDGDITNMADWHWEYFGEDAIRTARDLLWAADTLVMGRRTYEGMSPAWLSRAGDDDFADRMNALPKYVVSTTLTDAAWNSTVVDGPEAVARLAKAREQDGGTILQYGFGPVTKLLLAHNLLDELVLWLHPVLSGKAKQEELIYQDMAQQRFTLADVNVHSTGVAVLTYHPANR
jgi:dihydrofolate reductase